MAKKKQDSTTPATITTTTSAPVEVAPVVAPVEAQEQATIQKGRVGKGWRYCGNCDHSTKGVRSAVKCGHCGNEFPATKTTPTTSAPATTTANISIKDALTTLTKVRQFVQDCGGADKAQNIIATIGDLMGACGGLAAVQEAVDTLTTWDKN